MKSRFPTAITISAISTRVRIFLEEISPRMSEGNDCGKGSVDFIADGAIGSTFETFSREFPQPPQNLAVGAFFLLQLGQIFMIRAQCDYCCY